KSEGVEPQHSDRTPLRAPRMLRGRIQGASQSAEENGSDLSSEAAFFEALEKAGLELRMKDLQIYAGGMKKADWDVGMAVDAIRMSEFLDVIVLVTGDGDFIPLVDYLK